MPLRRAAFPGGVPAKFVKLTIEKNWSSSAPQTGLSEVRFFYIQSAAARWDSRLRLSTKAVNESG